nr:RNA-dependent RNA polymerase [Phomopsis viticola mitovirus 962_2]
MCHLMGLLITMLKTKYHYIRLLRGLIKLIFGPKAWSLFHPVIDVFISMWRENGYVYTIRYFKAVRLCITRYICSKPLHSINERVSLKNGFPTRFLFLKDIIDRGNSKELRMVLTIFQISKYFVPSRKEIEQVRPDYTPITDPYKGKVWTIPASFIKEFIKVYALESPYPIKELPKHYYSAKGSPFGKASLGSLKVTELSYPILGYMYRLMRYNTQWFSDFYTKVWESSLPKMVGTPSGKLSIVEDSELKRRVIAMVDYHSQWLLRPIHDRVMSLLRHFPCDRTYTQDPFHFWFGQGKFHSLDLSSATDRFPVKLQTKLLSYIWDKDLGTAWEGLLLGRDYVTPEGDLLRYSVGQPLGAYSSWAVFTLTHHLVVNYAASRCGYQCGSFMNYILLGDDIVIKDDRVAQVYVSIMTRLGVSISKYKTHVSKDTYEFAKRWVKAGTEITGLPLKGIGSNLNNYKVVFMLLFSYFEKVPGLYKGDLPGLVAELYSSFSKSLKKTGSRFLEGGLMKTPTAHFPKEVVKKARFLSFKKILKELKLLSVGVKFSRGSLNYDELRNVIQSNLDDTAAFMFPSEKDDYRKWFREFLSHGLAAHVQGVNKKMLSLTKPIMEKFKGNIDLVRESPLVMGIHNHIVDSYNHLRDYTEDGGGNVFDIANKVSFLDPAALFERNSKKVAVMDSVMKKSLRTYLPKDGLVYYGSSLGNSHSQDTSYLITAAMWNMEAAVTQLMEIRDHAQDQVDAWGRPIR